MNVKEIKPLESWNLLKEQKHSVLVDVRTNAEFNSSGITDLSTIGQQPILLPWRNNPNMDIDGEFNNKLQDILQDKFPKQNNNEINLLFICRSGIRSLEAANSMSKLNYQCYNITNGFEGKTDNNSNEGEINGWKTAQLPWRKG